MAGPPINFLSTLERIDDAIDTNADLVDGIVSCTLRTFGLVAWRREHEDFTKGRKIAKPHHLEKARSSVRQLYRDWSVAGVIERAESYGPILQDIDREFAAHAYVGDVKILVPGAGLGRLVFDICCKGYPVEGNEIAWHQLMVSNWVLNHEHTETRSELFPFLEQFSNVISREQQIQSTRVPDVDVRALLSEAVERIGIPPRDCLGMVAGDFVGWYSQEIYRNRFNAVATVFFIDTAPNLIKYIEATHNCLIPGGVWVNNGPFLWHFEDRDPAGQTESREDGEPMRDTLGMETEDSSLIGEAASTLDTASTKAYTGIEGPGNFELTRDETINLIESMGFRIEKHEIIKNVSGYVQNPDSMLQSSYRTSHWVARKLTI